MKAKKEALVPQPVLVLPDSTGNMMLYKDECDKQVGCVLLQKQDEELTWPINIGRARPSVHKKDTTPHIGHA